MVRASTCLKRNAFFYKVSRSLLQMSTALDFDAVDCLEATNFDCWGEQHDLEA